jgi:four helix bundle protein
MKTHKDLTVWQRSMDFVTKIYESTYSFPKEEIYGITSQIRRAAVSIPANIAEGSGRRNQKELHQFIYISLGSASELETLITIAKNLHFFCQSDFDKLLTELKEIIRMLSGLSKALE